MASVAITVDEEKVKRARNLQAGVGGSLTEGMPHGLFVECIESPFA